MFTRRRLLLVTINALVVIALLTTSLFGNGAISVATAHTLPASQPGSVLRPEQPQRVALPFSTTAAANSPTNLCQLYPIGLGNTSVAGVAVGGTVSGVVFGIQPANFDWLSWTVDRTEATLQTSLTPPRQQQQLCEPQRLVRPQP